MEDKQLEERITVVITEAYKEHKDLEGYIGLMEYAVHPALSRLNPKITIPKDGKDRVIWGCECWWGKIEGTIGDSISEEQLKQLKEKTQKSKAALILLSRLAIGTEKEPSN